MKVLVVSNCATSAYANGLRALFPDWDVRGVIRPLAESWSVGDTSRADFIDFARDCDVHIGLPAEGTRYAALLPPRARHVVIPSFRFRGLHPDSFHLQGFDSVLGRGGNLFSRIVVASFLAGRAEPATITLFNPATYDALGFFDCFAAERTALLDRFAAHGIDLTGCLERWLERGTFLYTLNHPRVDVFIDVLCRALAAADLLPAARRTGDISIADDLADSIVWPIYPEIASLHGLSGSLAWRRGRSNGFETLDLPAFVAATFAALSAGPPPDNPALADDVARIRSLPENG